MLANKIMFQRFKNQELVVLLLRITCIFWIFTKLFSYPLWHSDRLYPLVPAFDFLENIPQGIHLFLLFTALSAMALIVVYPEKKIVIAIALSVEFLSCMLDQSRWQPYEYQYFLTVLFFLVYRKDKQQFLRYFAFLLVVIYFNSGLHKLNPAFLYRVWDGMILHRFFGVSNETIASPIVHYSGVILGLIEVISAVGLLFFKQKRLYAWLLIGMHLFILLLISPTGLNYNSIVWPWNVVMILFLYLTYCNTQGIKISFKAITTKFNIVPFIVLGILPLLNFVGCYDDFLSFNLYSGSSAQMEICFEKDSDLKQYKPFMSDYATFCDDARSISINRWAVREMNVVPYPEERIYLQIISKFKAANPDLKATFYIFNYPYQPKDAKRYD